MSANSQNKYFEKSYYVPDSFKRTLYPHAFSPSYKCTTYQRTVLRGIEPFPRYL